MKCSSCQLECDNLVERHPDLSDEKARPAIGTLFLCALCEFVYRVKPSYITVRAAEYAAATDGSTRNVA
jgi:hypothetical protein